MTALGRIWLKRRYACCGACGQGGFAADRLLGVCGLLSARAKEMACLAGVSDPFRRAERLLAKLSGWKVDAETIRRLCHELAQDASPQHSQGLQGQKQTQSQRQALPDAFAQARGDYELHIDAGKVNTVEDGWRDVKVAVFGRRRRGEPSGPEDFAQRELPAPGVRSAVAGVEGRQDFGTRVEAEALRLRVPLGAGLSIHGDGAEWIWDLADDHFHGAACVLDFWHAAQKLAGAGKAALGEGAAFKAWLQKAKGLLAADGYAGAVQALAAPLDGGEARARMDAACPEALNYFAGNRERMGYAARLSRGQAIGSGLVEGTIKQVLNIRMKRTGARWKVGHVGPFVELAILANGPEWREYFASLAA